MWSYTPNSIEPSLTIFSFFIVRHGEGAPFGEYVYESGTDTTSGVLYIHEGPRPYYLMILAANTAGYTITVESDRSTEVGTGMLTLIIALVIAIPVALIIVMVYILRKRKRTQKAPTFAEYPQPPPPPPPA
ncbi:MAG TPA: hypothetical protein VJ574_00750 [Candidatus Bathyarchaeia archaeon]|nr:hypothetical protein [Candidatus Bathyarchaeia archaeon]